MRLPTLPSREDLSLLRMRHAYRSSEAISALLSAAILVPLLVLEAINVAVIIKFVKAGNFRAMLIGLVFTTIIFLLVGALFLLINWFFSSAGCLVSIVSLLVSAALMYLSMKAITQLALLAQAGKTDINITYAISFSQAVSFFFFWHAFRVGLLERVERITLSRNPFKEYFSIGLLRGFVGSGCKKELLSRALAGVLQVVAKMAQGVSIYVFSFLFGATVFTVSILPWGVISVVLQREPLPSFKRSVVVIFYGLAVYGIIFAIPFLLTHLAFVLKRFARYLTRFSFAQTVKRDKRPAILFLRSFFDDQVTLPKPPIYLRYWMAEPVPRRLDHALVERFGYLAPVVAIGKPGEEDKLPYGAARYFVTAKNWEPTVCEFAWRAQHVVVVVDDSPGIDWEVKIMLTEPLVDKSLFLASPKLASRGLETHPRIAPLLPPDFKLSKNFHVLAAFRENNTWRWLMAKKLTADDYIVSCQAFLRRDLAKAKAGLITEI